MAATHARAPAGRPIRGCPKPSHGGQNYSSRGRRIRSGRLTAEAATTASEISASSCTYAEWRSSRRPNATDAATTRPRPESARRAEPDGDRSRHRGRSRNAYRKPKAAPATTTRPRRDQCRGRQHPDRCPGPGRPWLCRCVIGASLPAAPERQQRQHGSNDRPTAKPARYSEWTRTSA